MDPLKKKATFWGKKETVCERRQVRRHGQDGEEAGGKGTLSQGRKKVFIRKATPIRGGDSFYLGGTRLPIGEKSPIFPMRKITPCMEMVKSLSIGRFPRSGVIQKQNREGGNL